MQWKQFFAYMRHSGCPIYVSPVKFIHKGDNWGTKDINTTVRNTCLAGIRNYTISWTSCQYCEERMLHPHRVLKRETWMIRALVLTEMSHQLLDIHGPQRRNPSDFSTTSRSRFSLKISWHLPDGLAQHLYRHSWSPGDESWWLLWSPHSSSSAIIWLIFSTIEWVAVKCGTAIHCPLRIML